VLSWFFCYLLWRGYNWVRILVLIGCVFTVLGTIISMTHLVPTSPEASDHPISMLLEVALAVAFFWLLLSKSAVSFFVGTPSAASKPAI